MWSVEPGAVTGSEPVSVDEAKQQCRVDGAEHDDLLGRLIKVAREVVEKRTGHVLRAQTLVFNVDTFPRPLRLPRAPIHSIAGIVYTGADGIDVALDPASYVLRRPLGVPTLRLQGITAFPPVAVDGDVEIEALAGYADGECPETLRHAILMIVADLFKSAESSVEGVTSVSVAIPVGVESLLADERLSWL